MRQRVITATIFVAVMLIGIILHKFTFWALFGGISMLCAWELSGLLFGHEARHILVRKGIGMGLSAIFFVVFTSYAFTRSGELPATNPLVVITALALPLLVLLATELALASVRPFANVGNYALMVFYTVLPFVLLVDLAIDDAGEYHALWVFGLMLLNWTNDTMAYFVGSMIGKTPFFSRISPKKTWEGTMGGIVCVLIVSWILSLLIPGFSTGAWLTLGATAALAGTTGDLVESMLKRSVQIKDTGDIMPGHGGFLDRFDSLIFFMPFAWMLLKIFFQV